MPCAVFAYSRLYAMVDPPGPVCLLSFHYAPVLLFIYPGVLRNTILLPAPLFPTITFYIFCGRTGFVDNSDLV